MIETRTPVRRLPGNNLAYPVFVSFENSDDKGSGFYISCSKGVFFVTARHVLQNVAGELKGKFAHLLSHDKDPSDASSNVSRIDLDKAKEEGGLIVHPSQDVAAIHISVRANDIPAHLISPEMMRRMQALGSDAFASVNRAYVNQLAHSRNGATSIRIMPTRRLVDVFVGNTVFVFGYPVSIGLRNSPQFDYKKPLLRTGIVAGKYEENGTLILDCSVYKGDSGGPVLEVSEELVRGGILKLFRLCGVVSQFVPYETDGGEASDRSTNSGYSIATAMDPLIEMLGLQAELSDELPDFRNGYG